MKPADFAALRRPVDEASHAPGWVYSSPEVYRLEVERLFMDAADVPFGPVNTYGKFFGDPQVLHRELVVHAEDPELGRVPRIRTPIRMSRNSVVVCPVTPRLGEPTDVAPSALGDSATEVEMFRRERIV